jgi:hypothetical protein
MVTSGVMCRDELPYVALEQLVAAQMEDGRHGAGLHVPSDRVFVWTAHLTHPFIRRIVPRRSSVPEMRRASG